MTDAAGANPYPISPPKTTWATTQPPFSGAVPASFINKVIFCYVLSCSDTNANSDADADPYANSHTNPDAEPTADTHTDAHTEANTDAGRDAACGTHSHTNANTTATPTATPTPTTTPSAIPSSPPTPTASPVATQFLAPGPTVEPATPPTATASPTPSPSPSPSLVAPAPVSDVGLPPGSFPTEVPTVSQVGFDATSIGESALLALLFLLLAAFPAQLFNKTYEENEEEINGWFARGGAAVAGAGAVLSRFWNKRIGIFTFVILSALLYGFLSPSFGLNANSIATLIGILLGIFIVVLAFELPLARAHRTLLREPGRVRVIPMTIVVALICVVASRFTDFQPGYLYGLVAGYVFARELSLRDEARAHVWTGVWMLGISITAWLAMPLINQSLSNQPLLDVLLSSAAATIFVAGLEGLLFELIPLRFLRGERVFAWRRSVWAVLFLVAAFLFAWIMLQPSAGYLGSTRTSPLIPAVILFCTFGVVSVAFWAYFRFRPQSKEPAEAS